MHGVNNGVKTYFLVFCHLTYLIYQLSFPGLLLLLLLLLFVTTFKQSLWNCIPVTNPVSWVYYVAVMINILCFILVLAPSFFAEPSMVVCYYCYYFIIIIVTIIIILVITLMQGIYDYIPETDHVSGVYIVATSLYLNFVLHVMLFRSWNTFCTFTFTLSVVSVQCPIWLFFVVP